MVEWIRAILIVYLRLPYGQSSVLAVLLAVALVLLLAALAHAVTRALIVRLVHVFIRRTNTQLDDALVENRVFSRLSLLAPAIVLSLMLPSLYRENEAWVMVVNDGVLIYVAVVVTLILMSLLDAGEQIYREADVTGRMPIKGFIQLVKTALIFVTVILAIAISMHQSPWVLISGLGAFSAVLLLVFRDALLGFVAGIQLTANRMLATGDWIEMPKYNADGEVTDVTLTTVKVRNWDKTITTLPTYALISDSFKNWRGMTESGGRRIKRAVNLDLNTVRFADDALLADLSQLSAIAGYLDEQRERLDGGEAITNLELFRAYLEAYLHAQPNIHQDMTFLVRELAPTPQGLPVEVYVFSNDQRWPHYEKIQAQIFDHIYAIVPRFGLRLYQQPAGADIQTLAAG